MLMMVNGFKTDPSQPGVEKMVIAEVNEKWLTEQNRMRISSSDLGLAGNDMLSPQTVFTVKGWNRAICALAVMRATFELREMLQGIRSNYSAFAGVSLLSTIRRRPNCFNLLHQCQMILTTGVSSDGALANLTALDNAAALASAYQIGKLEAQACTNLLKHIPPPIVEGLKELVRIHGQPKFLLHDGIAHGVFNASYNGASNSGAVSAWENLLQNTPEVLQRVCCAFKACCNRFRDLVPASFNEKVEKEIMSTFLHRHGDAELTSLIQATVPPADVNKEAEHKMNKAAGGLDMQYLSTRYENGKAKVGEFMQKRHCTVQHKNIVLAHGDVVEKQAELGPSTTFDVHEVALAYNMSSHQGDKRKTSQQCLFASLSGNRVNEFNKSKAALGSITAVDRSRVSDLQNPDEDKPLAAHFRVQQRGIPATREIINKLLEGVPQNERHPVLIVDCMPNRFAEWSSACLQMQLEELTTESYTGPCVTYMGIFLEDECSMSRALESSVAGKLMSNWIPDLVKNKYTTSHAQSLKTLNDMISSQKDVLEAVKGVAGEAAQTGPAAGAAVCQSRALASPDFQGQPVPNFERRVDFEEMTMDDFKASQTLHCSATLANSVLKIGKTENDGSWWLLNESRDNIDVPARELFGFNVGTFVEVPAGEATSLVDAIGWSITSDLDVVCLCSPGNAGMEKKLFTIAETVCSITRNQGATVVGPNNETKVLQFRYDITGRAKTNAFKPKPIDDNKLDVRYSQLGGCFSSYNTLLRSPNVGVIWEARFHNCQCGVQCFFRIIPSYHILGGEDI
ncbi:unnamed protein product [Cladocopium goreaui]|uniref:7,8-didemethyl-8-hydroxy-5-deazariboflavin synthase n=1 Tax=Cladocopium goreaui TaxID=2562237 RepID=A0A9P1CJ66_9DINO|nr:unnamed protein product [Cladocopium goreaui]